MCKLPKNSISPFLYTDANFNSNSNRPTYLYTTKGTLTKVVTPTNTIEYILNPLEQRVAKKVDGQITEKYLWADLTILLAVYDANDTLTQRYNYTHNRMPTSMTQNNQTYYLHYDQVGTLRLITDINQNIIKEITYDTFGNILQDTNPNFQVPFGFAGGLHDTDTNLVHFGYREYDPQTGKWTTKDPIDFNGGDSNLYGYVLGDPVNFIDPDGLMGLGRLPLPRYFPNRLLPRTKGGDPVPDSDLPHTQLGKGKGGYPQAREWGEGENGKVCPKYDYDFTDHGTPEYHPNPHQHPLKPNNPATAPKGGYKRGGAEPLPYEPIFNPGGMI